MKLMAFIMPIKFTAAMIFAGLMCLYMVSGTLYAAFTDVDFNYSIPFVFALQGIVLAILIAVLWELFFGDIVIKKWRFFQRIIAFGVSVMVFLAICFLTFLAIPTDWAYLWLLAAGMVTLGISVMSGLSEVYYRKTGERYTELLRDYKEKQGVTKQ